MKRVRGAGNDDLSWFLVGQVGGGRALYEFGRAAFNAGLQIWCPPGCRHSCLGPLKRPKIKEQD